MLTKIFNVNFFFSNFKINELNKKYILIKNNSLIKISRDATTIELPFFNKYYDDDDDDDEWMKLY